MWTGRESVTAQWDPVSLASHDPHHPLRHIVPRRVVLQPDAPALADGTASPSTATITPGAATTTLPSQGILLSRLRADSRSRHDPCRLQGIACRSIMRCAYSGGNAVPMGTYRPDHFSCILAVVWDGQVTVNLRGLAMDDAEGSRAPPCQIHCRELERARVQV